MVADQQQKRPRRRLFEDFEQRVAGAAVHFVDAVDDNDAPALFRRGQMKKAGDLTHVFDQDLAPQPTPARVPGALHRQQIGVAARRHAMKNAAVGIDRQRVLTVFRQAAPSQQKAGKAKGERGFADAPRPAQQDRVRHSPRNAEVLQLALGPLVADEDRVRARHRRFEIRFD